MQGITACLWFDKEAEEAARFYVSVFPNSKLGRITHYGNSGAEVSGQPKGSVMTVEFSLDGRPFLGLNGGPQFRFSEAVSFVIDCESQEEVDRYWSQLTADGGQEGPCGWLKDRFGLSWQVVPTVLNELVADPDPGRAERAMAAMLKMKKLNIAELQAAADGATA